MSETVISSLMLLILGVFFLYRNISFYRDDAKLTKYLENSRKAKLWVAKLGMEKTVRLSKKFFIPLGILIAVVLLTAGIYGLMIHFGIF